MSSLEKLVENKFSNEKDIKSQIPRQNQKAKSTIQNKVSNKPLTDVNHLEERLDTGPSIDDRDG